MPRRAALRPAIGSLPSARPEGQRACRRGRQQAIAMMQGRTYMARRQRRSTSDDDTSPHCTSVPHKEQMQIRYTHAKCGAGFFRRVEIGKIRSTILSRFTAENRWITTATPVNMEGDDANQFASRSVACCLCGRGGGAVAVDEPGIYRGRSGAAVHARCDAPLFGGNPGPRPHHRVHAQTARQFEPGVPQRVRQARTIGVGREVTLLRLERTPPSS